MRGRVLCAEPIKPFKNLVKPVKTGKATILGSTEKATISKKGDEYTITLPKSVRQKAKDAVVVVLP